MANLRCVIWVLSQFKSVILAKLTQIPEYQRRTVFEMGGENFPSRYLLVSTQIIYFLISSQALEPIMDHSFSTDVYVSGGKNC